MKKFLLFLAIPALMLVGCNNSELVYNGDNNPNELSIRPLASKMTKAGELTGISMPKTYGIYAAATQQNSKGVIENASFFADPFEQLFGTNDTDPDGIGTASAVADNRQWHAGIYDAGAFVENRMYWPIGGIRMDFLAYAMPMASHQDVLDLEADTAVDAASPLNGNWNMKWDNALTDAASQFTFYNVDTYAHQVDMLYAAANNQTNATNGGPDGSTQMAFRHAQALLIFNVKVNAEASGKLTINDIEFITDRRIAEQQEHERLLHSNPSHVLPDLANNDVVLKTVGTWKVDNSRNTLTSDWSFYSGSDLAYLPTRSANYRMPFGPHSEWAVANASYFADHTAWQAKKDAHDAWYAKVQTYGAWMQKKFDDDYENMSPEDKADWDIANPQPENPGLEPEAPGVEPQPAGDEPAADGVSNANSVVLSQTATEGTSLRQDYGSPIPFYGYDADSNPETPDVSRGYAQLGETLMIPEQAKVNFTLKYTLNNRVMYYKVNDLRGTWEAGKKYIYNLDLTMNEIVITEGVDDWMSTPVAVPIN